MKAKYKNLLFVVFVSCTVAGCDQPEPKDEVPEIYKSLQEPTDRSKDKEF